MLGNKTLRLFGWKIQGALPDEKKFVLIAAPHTSNWDFPIMLAATFFYQVRLRWLGKESLFRGPGIIFKCLGGIPVNRSGSNSMVIQLSKIFNETHEMVLAVPPEGTRRKTLQWKSGFYYISLEARVPIVFGFVDYRTKTTGLGPSILPTGNIESDMGLIREFYKDIEPKYPEKKGEIQIISKNSQNKKKDSAS